MSKLRVYTLAKDLGLDNSRLVALLQAIGVGDVTNHMSTVSPEHVERVKRHLERHADRKVVDERLEPGGSAGGVIIRRARKASGANIPSAPRTSPPSAQPVAAPSVRRTATERVRPETRDANRGAPLVRPAPPAPSAPAPSANGAAPPTPRVVPVESTPTVQGVLGQHDVGFAQDLPSDRSQAVSLEAVGIPDGWSSPLDVSARVLEGSSLDAAAEVSPESTPVEVPPTQRAVPPELPAADSRAVAENLSASAANRAGVPAKTGIDVWEGRPGVPMPQAPRGGVPPRRVQYDAKTSVGASRRAPMTNSRVSRTPRRAIGAIGARRPTSGAAVTQERSAHKKVVKIEENISLQALAGKMGAKAVEVLMKLMGLGMTGVNINSTLDSDTAKVVANEFGWSVEDVAVSENAAIAAAQGVDLADEQGERVPRPPVVTVMGHVDHGKTSLLDKIRRSSVASSEAGGITQHIGAYSVKTSRGRITFLDTPGHAAFSQMRARGAKCTDIVVLVVAADDGVMMQTKEAVTHAKDARCPIVVALSKVDKPEAQPERVRRQLADIGLVPEEWGGDTLCCEVSPRTGQGIDQLLEAILLQAEMLDLRANPKRHARGTVIEARLDRGRGPVATVLVTDGTLRKGDCILVGNSWGKVRAMLDDSGRNVAEAGPATPVAVIGLSEVSGAGDMVDSVRDAKKAQEIAEQRRARSAEAVRAATPRVSLEELARRMGQSDQKELRIIVKGDAQGSVEAITSALEGMSGDLVKVTVVHSAVGAITEGDVNLGSASRALIAGFSVRPAGKARQLAQQERVEIRHYTVIYDLMQDVKLSMEGLLAPTLVEERIGEAEVRKVFKVSKAGTVAGCMVTNGVVRRNALMRLHRIGELLWEGKLESLKRFKDDAKEVREGLDCGIALQGFSDVQEGDIVTAYEVKEVRSTL